MGESGPNSSTYISFREEQEIITDAMVLSGKADSTVFGLDDCRVKVNDETYQKLGKGIKLCDAWLAGYEAYKKLKINGKVDDFLVYEQDVETRRAVMPFIEEFNQWVKCERDRENALEKIAREFTEAKGGLTQIIEGLKGNTMPAEDIITKYEGFFEQMGAFYFKYVTQRVPHVK